MAIGKETDFKIYPEQFFGGMTEAVAQNLQGFNDSGAGTMVLTSQNVKGDYEKESYMSLLSGAVSRRDPTSTTTVSDIALTQGEFVRIKLNRRLGPIAQTLDSWKKIALDPMEMSFRVGAQFAQLKLQEMLNTAILCTDTALAAVAGLNYTTGTLTPTDLLSYTGLVKGMAKRGDQAGDIAAWVMHSKPFYDLVGQAITDKIFGVANIAIYQGTIATLGKPCIVTDSPSLFNVTGSGSTVYHTLGLVRGASLVEESEEQDIMSQMITGAENLAMRVQGEYAYNVGVRGSTYNLAGGGNNPTSTTLGTTSNWVQQLTSIKQLAGVRVLSR